MSYLKTDEIKPQNSNVKISGNLDVGEDGDPKALDVSGNAVVDGTIKGAGIGSNDDPGAITGALTLTNAKVASQAGGTVTMRESSGSGTLTQAGFIKAYLDDGTEIYIPYFTAHTGS